MANMKMRRTVSTRMAVAPHLQQGPESKVTEQTTEGLRRALFDQLDQLRNGDITPTVANATARLAEQIVATAQFELQVERHAHDLGKRGNRLDQILPPVIPLGDRAQAENTEIYSPEFDHVAEDDLEADDGNVGRA